MQCIFTDAILQSNAISDLKFVRKALDKTVKISVKPKIKIINTSMVNSSDTISIHQLPFSASDIFVNFYFVKYHKVAHNS
jgi:hypothetical protein